MAHIGMKYPVFSPMDESGAYKAGFVVGKAISYTGTPANNDVKLYADDGIAETDTSIQNEAVSLNVDEILLKVYANLLGHNIRQQQGKGRHPRTWRSGWMMWLRSAGSAFTGEERKTA